METLYLITKRGLYYRPKAAGYTGIKEEAGRYTLEETSQYFPNMDSADQDGMTFVEEKDAPEYSISCCSGIKERHKDQTIATLSARVEKLEGALKEYSNSNNWILNGRFDANSGKFDGDSFARAALQEE